MSGATGGGDGNLFEFIVVLAVPMELAGRIYYFAGNSGPAPTTSLTTTEPLILCSLYKFYRNVLTKSFFNTSHLTPTTQTHIQYYIISLMVA